MSAVVVPFVSREPSVEFCPPTTGDADLDQLIEYAYWIALDDVFGEDSSSTRYTLALTAQRARRRMRL